MFTDTSLQTSCGDRRIVILERVGMASQQKTLKKGASFFVDAGAPPFFANKYYALAERNIIC